jgi:hypothetical protein
MRVPSATAVSNDRIRKRRKALGTQWIMDVSRSQVVVVKTDPNSRRIKEPDF